MITTPDWGLHSAGFTGLVDMIIITSNILLYGSIAHRLLLVSSFLSYKRLVFSFQTFSRWVCVCVLAHQWQVLCSIRNYTNRNFVHNVCSSFAKLKSYYVSMPNILFLWLLAICFVTFFLMSWIAAAGQRAHSDDYICALVGKSEPWIRWSKIRKWQKDKDI